MSQLISTSNKGYLLSSAQPATTATTTAYTSLATITLPNNPLAAKYHFVINYTLAAPVGNAYFNVRMKSGANNTDFIVRADATAGATTLMLVMDLIPVSTTSGGMISHIGGTSGGATTDVIQFQTTQTFAGGTLWTAQTSFDLMARFGTSGTFTLNSYTCEVTLS